MSNDEVREIWDANAAYWNEYMGDEGNDFHRFLVAPAAERLLALRPAERVLEIGCGAGLFARRLHQLGAAVVAVDFSAAFLAIARARLLDTTVRIEQVDATDADALRALGVFDAVVSNMVLMDMADIVPLFDALPDLLAPGGRFVCTLCHPCFNTDGCVRLHEHTDEGGQLRETFGVRVTRYRHLAPAMGIGVPGQPRPQYYFNRTLSTLCGAGFARGLVVDGLEEPTWPDETPSSLFAGVARELPMVLGLRFRAAQTRAAR